MVNFIDVSGPTLATTGNIWDIDTNVSPVLVAVIAQSNVLNEDNTTPPLGSGTTIWITTVPKHIVFSEIETYLQSNPETKDYTVTIPGKRFEW